MKLIQSESYTTNLIKTAGFGTGHFRAPTFYDSFARLPKEVQRAATTNYERMLSNPQAVGMKTMPQTPGSFQVYSAQIGRNYRALSIKVGSYYVWYWIGTHEEYNSMKAKQPPGTGCQLARNIMNKGKV